MCIRDRSVGGLISFTNCLAAAYMPDSVGGIVLFSFGILLAGAAAGMFNGFIIVKFRLQPFIATLTTWAIWSGAAPVSYTHLARTEYMLP